MTPMQEIEERIRHYLLGQLSDGPREEIERALLTNEDAFAELLIIEDELTDEYLNNQLNPDDRADFERHFLAAPERQEDLRFAQALNRYVNTTHASERATSMPIVPSRQAKPLRIAAAVAVVVILASALWFGFFHHPASTAFVTVTLTISPSTREEGVQSPRIKSPGRDTLRVFLILPNPPPPAVRYRVQLLEVNGEYRSLEVAGQDNQSVIVEIPGAQLARGQYALSLSAVKADGTEQRLNYYFTIE
jgi:hypothetical protein